MEIEIWEDVEESLGLYQVSNFGRVKSIKRTCQTYQGTRTVPEKILNINYDRDGYIQVVLKVNGKSLSRRVHRLIAIAFIPNPENKKTINHKNGVKTDNRIENLEWATFGENNLHACQTGLRLGMKGSKHVKSKLTEKDILEIRNFDLSKSYTQIGLIYGISAPTVCNIRKRKTWNHV